jgi:hypothetical protein
MFDAGGAELGSFCCGARREGVKGVEGVGLPPAQLGVGPELGSFCRAGAWAAGASGPWIASRVRGPVLAWPFPRFGKLRGSVGISP